MFCACYIATEDLVDVKQELGDFVNWYDLGLNFRLSPDSLDMIEEDHRSTKKRLQAVLLQWLRKGYNIQKYGLPSWAALADAVKPINHALAMTIKDRHS